MKKKTSTVVLTKTGIMKRAGEPGFAYEKGSRYRPQAALAALMTGGGDDRHKLLFRQDPERVRLEYIELPRGGALRSQ